MCKKDKTLLNVEKFKLIAVEYSPGFLKTGKTNAYNKVGSALELYLYLKERRFGYMFEKLFWKI